MSRTMQFMLIKMETMFESIRHTTAEELQNMQEMFTGELQEEEERRRQEAAEREDKLRNEYAEQNDARAADRRHEGFEFMGVIA
jgi:hypothetical protein